MGVSIDLAESNTDSQSGADPNSTWDGRWPRVCAICGQSLNCNHQWVLHLNGKRHNKALKTGKKPVKRERNKNKRRRLAEERFGGKTKETKSIDEGSKAIKEPKSKKMKEPKPKKTKEPKSKKMKEPKSKKL